MKRMAIARFMVSAKPFMNEGIFKVQIEAGKGRIFRFSLFSGLFSGNAQRGEDYMEKAGVRPFIAK